MSLFAFRIWLLLVVLPFLIGQYFFRVRASILCVPPLSQRDPDNGWCLWIL